MQCHCKQSFPAFICTACKYVVLRPRLCLTSRLPQSAIVSHSHLHCMQVLNLKTQVQHNRGTGDGSSSRVPEFCSHASEQPCTHCPGAGAAGKGPGSGFCKSRGLQAASSGTNHVLLYSSISQSVSQSISQSVNQSVGRSVDADCPGDLMGDRQDSKSISLCTQVCVAHIPSS